MLEFVIWPRKQNVVRDYAGNRGDQLKRFFLGIIGRETLCDVRK